MSSSTPLSLRPNLDWLLRAASLGCALTAAALLLLILLFVTQASWPLLQQPASLLGATWQPSSGQFGLQAMLGASLLSSLLALVLAVPAGLLVSIWLIFYAPAAVARVYGAMLGLMASIPSVVYGLWGLVVLVPLLGAWVPPGARLLAAGMVLALMILPLLMVQADVALRKSARRHLPAALCLGVSPWSAIRRVLLLDEPCSALDPIASATLEGLIDSLKGRYTLLMVTYNLAQARRLADHVAVCWVRDGCGCVLDSGPAEQLFASVRDSLAHRYLNGMLC